MQPQCKKTGVSFAMIKFTNWTLQACKPTLGINNKHLEVTTGSCIGIGHKHTSHWKLINTTEAHEHNRKLI